jgi:hypothetical protein
MNTPNEHARTHARTVHAIAFHGDASRPGPALDAPSLDALRELETALGWRGPETSGAWLDEEPHAERVERALATADPEGVSARSSFVDRTQRARILDALLALLSALEVLEARAWDRCARDAEEATLREDLERGALGHVLGQSPATLAGYLDGRTSASVSEELEREGRRVFLEHVDRDEDPHAEAAQERLLARAEDEGFRHGDVSVRHAGGFVFLSVTGERVDDEDEDEDEEPEREPTDAERVEERADACGLDAAEVLEGFTRYAWADAWGSALERAAEEEDEAEARGFVRPNLSGVDLCEAAPDAPGEFRAWARVVVREVLGHVRPATLRAWAEYGDAERVGGLLYLDAVGHGAGLADEDLPRVGEEERDVRGLPYSGGLVSSFGYLEAPLLDWRDLADDNGEHVLPTDAEVLEADACSHCEAGRSPEGAARAIVGLARAWRAGTVDEEDALRHADRILGGFGVESVDLPAPEDGESGGTFRYVNRGDTYAGTVGILEDWRGSRFLVADWGSVLEEAEAERTTRTGETRCAYCGEDWRGGLDAAGLDFLDAERAGPCDTCGHEE